MLSFQVVGNIRAAVKRELGFSMSFGIAEGKLAARLAGPLHKPSRITIVPPQHAARFLLGTPILKVPLLRSVHALFLEGNCVLFTGSALLSNTPRGYCCFSPVVHLARQKSIHVQYVTALQACMPAWFTYAGQLFMHVGL